MLAGLKAKITGIRRSLGGRVMILLAGVLFAAFAYMICIGVWTEYRHTTDVVHKSDMNQTLIIAQQARHGIQRRDTQYLENVLYDFIYNQDKRDGHGARISAIIVQTTDGRVLRQYRTGQAGSDDTQLLAEMAANAIDAGEVIDAHSHPHQFIAVPVRAIVGNRVVGSVAVAWDESQPMDRLMDHAMRMAVIGTASALVVIKILMLTIRHVVVRPIVTLADSMVSRRAATGDVDLPEDLLERRDEIGQLARRYKCLMEDLTQARNELEARSEAEIQKRNSRLDAALNNMSQGLCLFDGDFNLIICNDRFIEMYRLDPSVAEHGTSLERIVRAMIGTGAFRDATVARLLDRYQRAASTGRESTLQDDLSNGQTISIHISPRNEEGWVVTFEDVTERRAAEAKIEYMARYDDLTGLPNRASFRTELGNALKGVERGGELAVFCLDLDQFKPVNDTLGHPVGDKLLKSVADRLRGTLRETDFVARLGGDEFAVIMKDFGDGLTPAALAMRIIDTLGEPYVLEGHQVVIGSSIGIAHAPQDANDADSLVKMADLALYRAKGDGRGVYRFFEAGMDERMQERRALEIDLRAALANGEFVVEYQPIVNIETSRVSCFETLIRWNHPQRGRVAPDDFIPVAEETGLITQIGSWVLMQACMDAKTWPENIRVAVNLSPMQFRDEDLVMDVVMALNRSGLEPHRLELEITETVLLQDTETTTGILHRIRELGVRISMDDFGTGYCSLSYLQKFPLDKIKIDKSFVDDIAVAPDAAAIIRAIAGLGASLGMSTTAEGVETDRQLQRLRDEGCTEVQGFYFSHSVPRDSVAELLDTIHQDDPGANDSGPPNKNRSA
ncbi:putative bifunctional diguanylate cyclase/phosphodiesterase [Amaricoccus tamworthensis]|uniref:putative bifunctional diguanylate cyclase/phosphodiesterase n=1 Tax=Amaricoccus tamworthensis TaxID=57002 RepID=UPI003C7D3381